MLRALLCLSLALNPALGQEEPSEAPTIVTTTTTTEEPLVLENAAGPEHFYFENGKLPKFLMRVQNGINLTLYSEGREWDTFCLDQAAKGGIAGSRTDLDKDEFKLEINYKGQEFLGRNGNRLPGLEIVFKFERRGSTWEMTDLSLQDIPFKGEFVTASLGRETALGYAVTAPTTLAFTCYNPGQFVSRPDLATGLSAGLTFPAWQLQVFQVARGRFGPEWECGEMLSIGLWVGILVSLGFATICFWGFSMLASINTMDRFDDPKGKQIYVPQASD